MWTLMLVSQRTIQGSRFYLRVRRTGSSLNQLYALPPSHLFFIQGVSNVHQSKQSSVSGQLPSHCSGVVWLQCTKTALLVTTNLPCATCTYISAWDFPNGFWCLFCMFLPHVIWSWEHSGAACSFVHLKLLMCWYVSPSVWERGHLYTECQRVYLWFLRFLLGSPSQCWYVKMQYIFIFSSDRSAILL